MLTATPMTARAQGMPAPLWRGVSRIVLACAADIEPSLCDVLHERARALSSLPVDRAPGREAQVKADRTSVILDLSIERDGGEQHLTGVARRALEIDDAEGVERHSVPWNAAAAPTEAIDRLLRRILPHRPDRGPSMGSPMR